ncbi:MAG: prenyltransferase/squalene oxidase repeat-containing protein, partial [Bryobacteraceae bacterium]
GAAFNLAITLIDYAVDELGSGERLFRFLDASLVRNIFAAPDLAQSQLAGAMRETEDLRERLLCGLVAFCASNGWRLFQATGNRAAWENLGKTIARLLEGEQEVAKTVWPTRTEARRLLPYMEAKSCLPSAASLHIAQLAHKPAAMEFNPGLVAAAKWLGTVFWRVDDLVDLLQDLRTGTPNVVLLSLSDRLAAEGRSFASDKDIYDELDAAAEELIQLLVLPPEHGIGPRESLSEFARGVVAGWVGAQGSGESARGAADHGENNGRRVSSDAIAFLLAQQSDGYREAIHHLHFPRLTDEGVRYETRPSILSHRAVILDALLDGAEAGLDCPRQVLATECMAILRSKHRDVRGGWSYIEEAPELPPDADDLGQVLQVLTRFGGGELASICEEAIRLTLDASEADGSFCTWILDPGGQSFAHERMRKYLDVMGGWGTHPEVVANLLYGLWLYDPVRYSVALRRSVTYLERVQNPVGSWSSKWYTGPFYGTWRAVSVLGRVAPSSGALMRARHFLLDAQHTDGGWGDGGSEPLSTALAMLSLSADGIEPEAVALSRGSAYLSQTQRSDGGWPSCPWISFPTIDGMVVHGSAGVTTAFCLKGLLAAEQVVKRFEPVLQGSTYAVGIQVESA